MCLLHKPAMEATSKLALINVFSSPHQHMSLAQVVSPGGFPLLCPSQWIQSKLHIVPRGEEKKTAWGQQADG